MMVGIIIVAVVGAAACHCLVIADIKHRTTHTCKLINTWTHTHGRHSLIHSCTHTHTVSNYMFLYFVHQIKLCVEAYCSLRFEVECWVVMIMIIQHQYNWHIEQAWWQNLIASLSAKPFVSLVHAQFIPFNLLELSLWPQWMRMFELYWVSYHNQTALQLLQWPIVWTSFGAYFRSFLLCIGVCVRVWVCVFLFMFYYVLFLQKY